MSKLKIISLLLLSISLYGCSIQELSYFQVEPYAKPFVAKISEPLNIVLLADVMDTIIVEGEGVKKMTVTDFRKSFGESLKNTLNRNFEVVNILNSRPETGLSLVIYRVRPFWKLNSQSSSSYGTGGNVNSITTSLIGAAFQFESTLFLDEEKNQSADMTIFSDDQMSTVYQAHAVFKSGLIKTCETINKEIFTDDVVKKINAR